MSFYKNASSKAYGVLSFLQGYEDYLWQKTHKHDNIIGSSAEYKVGQHAPKSIGYFRTLTTLSCDL